MNTAAAVDGARAAAEQRRFDLLQQIAPAGGKIEPLATPYASHGYKYTVVGDDVERDLNLLARRGYLEERFFDRVSLCPKCDSHHLNVREVCPTCGRAHLSSEGLFHHFRCGYVGIPSEFSPGPDGSYQCPKCNGKMRHLGTQYDRLGRAFLCRACGVVSETPPVEAVCLSCGERTRAEDLVSTVVFSYVLTSRGAAALRRRSLLDGDEDSVSLAEAPEVYRPAMIHEFLEHEMSRLQHFNEKFSVLLATGVPNGQSQKADGAPAELLSLMRRSVREVDLIGRWADQTYIVILPRTKRREAEALRDRIAAELGPESPISLTIAEIAERRHLSQVLTGLCDRAEAT
jgi:hypothetical protein